MMSVLAFVCCVATGLTIGGETKPAPDFVKLVSGRVYKGRVVLIDDERVVLQAKSRAQEFNREKVAEIDSALEKLPSALDEVAGLSAGDIAGYHELAGSLRERNLPLEADLLDWLVLSYDANDEVSNASLGHRKRGKNWTLKHNKRWCQLAEREAKLPEWSDSWEFASTHYRVQTNLPLRTAIAATFDLERTYRTFYQMFRHELELWEITERMEVRIFADAKSFPESLGQGRSYFSRSDRALFVNAAQGLDVGIMVHEATHGLLFFSAMNTRGGRGDLPGWLNEGLAEYVEAGQYGALGRLEFAPGRPNFGHFAEHAAAPKPYRLNRVLNFQDDDFSGSSKTHLKYAQSYSLVHFCLHAESGRFREPFYVFLRNVYAGKSSSTHFKKSFELREKDLEEAWHAYAEEARSE